MLQTLTNPLSRWVLACALVAAPLVFPGASLAQTTSDSFAQMPPGAAPPPPQAAPPGVAGQQPGASGNPICQRLEVQLPPVERGGWGDRAKDGQTRRYQDAQARQQAELDRITQQGRRTGCGDANSFFSIFNQQNSQCGPINSQIQKMRGNL